MLSPAAGAEDRHLAGGRAGSADILHELLDLVQRRQRLG
jgi:hypothetical protein